MKSWVSCTREVLAKELVAYGEEEAAKRIPALSEADFRLIGEKAFVFTCSQDPLSGRPMLIAKALSMAAIAIIEGNARDLKRKKRRLR